MSKVLIVQLEFELKRAECELKRTKEQIQTLQDENAVDVMFVAGPGFAALE